MDDLQNIKEIAGEEKWIRIPSQIMRRQSHIFLMKEFHYNNAYLRFCCELDKEKPCSYACTLQEAKASSQLS